VYAAPFSHQLHLKLIGNCAHCHATASSSTKASDNLLPDSRICAGCHEQQPMAIPAPTPTAVAHFNHELHLKFGNVARMLAAAIDRKTYLSPPAVETRSHLDTQNPCGACHRGMEESQAVSHVQNMPHMADCLVCHNKIDPPDSCAKCHSKELELKPVSHNKDFFSNHSSGKLGLDMTTCAVCHGRRFTCLGCH
jgi:hypothetical protein